jgi:hypothetical protein
MIEKVPSTKCGCKVADCSGVPTAKKKKVARGQTSPSK